MANVDASTTSSSNGGRKLAGVLLSDTVSGFLTAACVSPAVAIIDRSIIASVSGKTPLLVGLKDGFQTLLLRPWVFAKQPSVLAVFAVYSTTYVTANTVESVCIHNAQDPVLPKFAASSFVNISATIWKDRLLTRWFGNTAPKPLPGGSYFLFGLRDSLTMAASFTLPPILSASLQAPEGLGLSKPTADVVAQLTLPVAFQVSLPPYLSFRHAKAISTPIHLLGLQLYNVPAEQAGGWRGRLQSVAVSYPSATLARMGRILPAFGIGGVVNRSSRQYFSEALAEKRGIPVPMPVPVPVVAPAIILTAGLKEK
ncbi:hypothetical protein HDU96_006723 [Phlyctochytrium bullatum]|nr:hypothetical protein HDU96_006723 [Phlyctochytrium bullatum]